MHKHIADKEAVYRTQIRSLQAENSSLQTLHRNSLKVSREKENFNKTMWQKIREEMDQVERMHARREEELQLVNQGLQREVEVLEEVVKSGKKRETAKEVSVPLDRVAASLRTQLEQQKKDCMKFAELYNQTAIQLKEEKQANMELVQKFSERHMKLLTIEEMGGKITLAEQQAAATEKIALAKIAELQTEASRLQAEHAAEKKQLLENSQLLAKEKENIETQLEELLRLYNEKLEVAQEKIAELSNCTERLLSESKTKEEKLNSHFMELVKGFLDLQKDLEHNNTQSLNIKGNLKRDDIKKTIEEALKKLEDGRLRAKLPALCAAHQKDIKVLKEQLAIKEGEVAALSKISNGNNSHFDFIKQSNKNYECFMSELERMRIALETCAASSKQPEFSALQRLLQENSNLKHELALHYETNIEMLRAELVQTQIELREIRKAALVSDELSAQGKSRGVVSSSELDRAKVEILKLTAENEGLLNELKEVKEYYMNLVGQLEKSLAAKLRQLQSVSSMLLKLR